MFAFAEVRGALGGYAVQRPRFPAITAAGVNPGRDGVDIAALTFTRPTRARSVKLVLCESLNPRVTRAVRVEWSAAFRPDLVHCHECSGKGCKACNGRGRVWAHTARTRVHLDYVR